MPNRKQLARGRRRKEAASLYLSGLSRKDIAKRLGVSIGTIGHDLGNAERDLKFQAADFLMQARQEQRKNAAHYRKEALEAWERSKLPFKSQRQERALVKAGEKADGAPSMTEGRVTLTQEERVGDPRYLMTALSVDQHEARLLGLYSQPEVGGDDIPTRPGDVLVIRVASNPI